MNYIEIYDTKIIVNTPCPYEISRKDRPDLDDVEINVDWIYEMREKVKYLYDCMRVLGIAKKTAREQCFTLNDRTTEILLDIAGTKFAKGELSHQMFDSMRKVLLK